MAGRHPAPGVTRPGGARRRTRSAPARHAPDPVDPAGRALVILATAVGAALVLIAAAVFIQVL